MLPAEFLAFALYFWALGSMARHYQTDADYVARLRLWLIVQSVLFVIFTILVYVLPSGFMTIYGAVYLLSLFLAFAVTIRMVKTIEAPLEPATSAAAGAGG